MVVEFTAQELRNVFSGLDRDAPQLDPFDADDTVFLERNLADKVFKVYGASPKEERIDPLVTVGPGEEGAFGFINRYYMLRDGTYDPMNSDRNNS